MTYPNADGHWDASWAQEDNHSGHSSVPQKKRNVMSVVLVTLLVLAALIAAVFVSLNTRDQAPSDFAASGPFTTVNVASTASSTEATSAQETTQPAKPQQGACDPTAVVKNTTRKALDLFCDGQWLLVGQEGSAFLDVFRWTGSDWKAYESDGKLPNSGYSCYDQTKLEREQAPRGLVNAMQDKSMFCVEDRETTTVTTRVTEVNDGDWLQYPKCDGEYVLIVDSVVVNPGVDPQGPVSQSLAAHPGTVAVYPGVCAALRASVNGAAVYPVYIDFGSDLDSVCAAEARGEGFARKLQPTADYSSPC